MDSDLDHWWSLTQHNIVPLKSDATEINGVFGKIQEQWNVVDG